MPVAAPHSKLVLAGYSLGAQIVGDMLAGGGGGFYGCTERTNSGLSPYSSPGNQSEFTRDTMIEMNSKKFLYEVM